MNNAQAYRVEMDDACKHQDNLRAWTAPGCQAQMLRMRRGKREEGEDEISVRGGDEGPMAREYIFMACPRDRCVDGLEPTLMDPGSRRPLMIWKGVGRRLSA